MRPLRVVPVRALRVLREERVLRPLRVDGVRPDPVRADAELPRGAVPVGAVAVGAVAAAPVAPVARAAPAIPHTLQ